MPALPDDIICKDYIEVVAGLLSIGVALTHHPIQ